MFLCTLGSNISEITTPSYPTPGPCEYNFIITYLTKIAEAKK